MTQGSYYNTVGYFVNSSFLLYVHREETRSSHYTNNGGTIPSRPIKDTEALMSILHILKEDQDNIWVKDTAIESFVIPKTILRKAMSSRTPVGKSVLLYSKK